MFPTNTHNSSKQNCIQYNQHKHVHFHVTVVFFISDTTVKCFLLSLFNYSMDASDQVFLHIESLRSIFCQANMFQIQVQLPFCIAALVLVYCTAVSNQQNTTLLLTLPEKLV